MAAIDEGTMALGELTLTRRAALQAGLVGAGALVYGGGRRPAVAQAATSANVSGPGGVYAFNQDWLFGGAYVNGAEAAGYSERGFAQRDASAHGNPAFVG